MDLPSKYINIGVVTLVIFNSTVWNWGGDKIALSVIDPETGVLSRQRDEGESGNKQHGIFQIQNEGDCPL